MIGSPVLCYNNRKEIIGEEISFGRSALLGQSPTEIFPVCADFMLQ